MIVLESTFLKTPVNSFNASDFTISPAPKFLLAGKVNVVMDAVRYLGGPQYVPFFYSSNCYKYLYEKEKV